MPKFTRKERDLWDASPEKERRKPKLMRRMLRQQARSLASDCASNQPAQDDDCSSSSEHSLFSGASTKPPLRTRPPRPPKKKKKKNPNWQALKRNKKKENEYDFMLFLSLSLYEQNERNKILHKYLMDCFVFSQGDHSFLDEADKIYFHFEHMDDLASVKTGNEYCDVNID